MHLISKCSMKIVQIISEHKRLKRNVEGRKQNTKVPAGMKRVMAIVQEGRNKVTRHIDVPA